MTQRKDPSRTSYRAVNKINVDDEKLLHWYVTQGRSIEEIAKVENISRHALYRRARELGVTRTNSQSHRGLQVGPRNPMWRGGRTTHRGYVKVRVGGRQVFEHRVVAESLLGRPLTAQEVVHHKNHNKSDNRAENLLVTNQSDHARDHMTQDRLRHMAESARRKRRIAALRALGVEA